MLGVSKLRGNDGDLPHDQRLPPDSNIHHAREVLRYLRSVYRRKLRGSDPEATEHKSCRGMPSSWMQAHRIRGIHPYRRVRRPVTGIPNMRHACSPHEDVAVTSRQRRGAQTTITGSRKVDRQPKVCGQATEKIAARHSTQQAYHLQQSTHQGGKT